MRVRIGVRVRVKVMVRVRVRVRRGLVLSLIDLSGLRGGGSIVSVLACRPYGPC